MQIKALAHGNCWTGFGLDVVSSADMYDQEKAINCLKGDWLIFELISKNDRAEKCIKTKLDYSENASIAALGGPRVKVKRSTGLTKLDGRIYSKGNIFSL